eukprot:INCI19044.1.p1 GENE.INCI19044.1~~INCI19044.1.p1  ORF type:complete len:431 (-),score=60.62 INCI19044.1:33-1325(-)
MNRGGRRRSSASAPPFASVALVGAAAATAGGSNTAVKVEGDRRHAGGGGVEKPARVQCLRSRRKAAAACAAALRKMDNGLFLSELQTIKGAVVAGSFPLSFFYPDQWQPGDIDVWIPRKSAEALFLWRCQEQHAYCVSVGGSFPSGYPHAGICCIVNAKISGRNVQFIFIDGDDMKQYISQQFDLSVCMTSFDGEKIHVEHPADVARGRSHVLRSFPKTAERIEKYRQRGFRIKSSEAKKAPTMREPVKSTGFHYMPKNIASCVSGRPGKVFNAEQLVFLLHHGYPRFDTLPVLVSIDCKSMQEYLESVYEAGAEPSFLRRLALDVYDFVLKHRHFEPQRSRVLHRLLILAFFDPTDASWSEQKALSESESSGYDSYSDTDASDDTSVDNDSLPGLWGFDFNGDDTIWRKSGFPNENASSALRKRPRKDL